MYKEYGKDFVNHLDGGFLVIIYDPSNQTIDFFTDPWATRQAHYTAGDLIYSFSSWPTDKSKQLKWNSHYQYSIGDNQLKLINDEIYKWDLRQYKDTLEDMTIAFEEAVLKRYNNNTVSTLGGIDSSCIALCLADNKKQFNSVHLSAVQVEDENTLSTVIEYTKPYNNFIRFDELPEENGFHNETAFYAQIHKVVSNFEFVISGDGADPVFFNDMIGDSKQFDGEFNIWPEDLSTIFPWTLFYGARRVMNAREHHTLKLNLCWKTPFRDKKFVQEWLNVSHKLKNRENKLAKIMQIDYLKERNIPIPTVHAGIGHQWPNRPDGGWVRIMKTYEQFI